MFFLVWRIITFDPHAHDPLMIREYTEPHLTAESCLNAKDEMLALAKIKAKCFAVGEPPVRTKQLRALTRAIT